MGHRIQTFFLDVAIFLAAIFVIGAGTVAAGGYQVALRNPITGTQTVFNQLEGK